MRVSPALLPVLKRPNTDPEQCSEPFLGEAIRLPDRLDVRFTDVCSTAGPALAPYNRPAFTNTLEQLFEKVILHFSSFSTTCFKARF